MIKKLKTPKGYMIIATGTLVFLGAMFSTNHNASIWHVILAVIAAILTEYAFMLRQDRKQFMIDGTIITGILIGGVFSGTTNWTTVVIATIIAIASKNIFRVNNKPLFNPAVFALFFIALFLQGGENWWIAMSATSIGALLFVLIGGYLIVARVNKFPLVFSFLFTYLTYLTYQAFQHNTEAIHSFGVPFINIALFFALFMLTDPPTTPAKPKEQVVFGVLVALISGWVYCKFGGFVYLFSGLLTSNLLYTGYAVYKKAQKNAKKSIIKTNTSGREKTNGRLQKNI